MMPGQLKRPPSPELIKQAKDLLADGASQREVQRTTGISRGTLRKYFPGQFWTQKQGGDFAALIRKDY